MGKITVGTIGACARRTKRVRTSDGFGSTRVDTHVLNGTVRVIVDLSKLQLHANRAMASKRGRSVLASGGIEFVVVPNTTTATELPLPEWAVGLEEVA